MLPFIGLVNDPVDDVRNSFASKLGFPHILFFFLQDQRGTLPDASRNTYIRFLHKIILEEQRPLRRGS